MTLRFRTLVRRLLNRLAGQPEHAHPLGHFYSPIVDPRSLDTTRLWPQRVRLPEGIDFNDSSHAYLIGEVLPRFAADFDYPEEGRDDDPAQGFYVRNSQFGWLDARLLFVLLRHWQPARIVEIGSGYSTLLIDDVARRFLGGTTGVTAIEPFPRPFLHRLGNVDLLEQRVQDVDPGIFDQLQAGDVLFVDSSHVAKTGSDVNCVVFDILPRLRSGVHVHFHDIFLPCEYPKPWVLEDNRSWNEQYLIHALLMYSTRLRISFGSAYAFLRHKQALATALGLPEAIGGSSLWIEVV